MTPVVVRVSITVLCSLLHADRFLPSQLTASEAPLASWLHVLFGGVTVCDYRVLGVSLS